MGGKKVAMYLQCLKQNRFFFSFYFCMNFVKSLLSLTAMKEVKKADFSSHKAGHEDILHKKLPNWQFLITDPPLGSARLNTLT